jgi:hypothetical protein
MQEESQEEVDKDIKADPAPVSFRNFLRFILFKSTYTVAMVNFIKGSANSFMFSGVSQRKI